MYAQVFLRAPLLCSLYSTTLTNLRPDWQFEEAANHLPWPSVISVATQRSFSPRPSRLKHHHGATYDRYSSIWLCPSRRGSDLDLALLAGWKYFILHSTFHI